MSTTIWDDPALAGARDGVTQNGDTTQGNAAATAEKPRRNRKRTKKKPSKLYGAAMRLIRRVHLYSGLFMLPFVLLYGISAVYFNHPELTSTSTTREFDASALANSGLPRTPEPQRLAQEILTAINTQATDSVPRPLLELSENANPQFSGSMTYSYRSDDEQFTISVDPAAQSARLRRSEIRSTNMEPNPFSQLPERPELIELSKQARAAALAVLQEAGVETEAIDPSSLVPSRRRGARFQFDAHSAGEMYRVSYDLTTGRGTATPLSEDFEIEPERFLMRLHVSHGYPDEMNIRWWWAFIVDAMFVNMVMWGLSGVLMWWQLKKTRKLGIAFLVASAVVTCWLFIGMHDEMVANSKARSAPRPQVTSPTKSNSGERPEASSSGRSGQSRREKSKGRSKESDAGQG